VAEFSKINSMTFVKQGKFSEISFDIEMKSWKYNKMQRK